MEESQTSKKNAEALAAESYAEKRAEAERFRQRVEAAPYAVEIEAAELLAQYDRCAVALADVLTRIDAINAEADAVNEAGRHTPDFEPVRGTDVTHRKQPDRPASERREKRLCWALKYSASPPDIERMKFQREAPREDMV